MGGDDNVGGDGTSSREQRAARLVEAQTGELVECKDNGGVNVEVYPEYPVGYSCYNEAGEFYNAMVSPEDVLLSLTRLAGSTRPRSSSGPPLQACLRAEMVG